MKASKKPGFVEVKFCAKGVALDEVRSWGLYDPIRGISHATILMDGQASHYLPNHVTLMELSLVVVLGVVNGHSGDTCIVQTRSGHTYELERKFLRVKSTSDDLQGPLVARGPLLLG